MRQNFLLFVTSVSYRFTLRKLDFACSQTLRELIGVLELGHQISYDAVTLRYHPCSQIWRE